MLNDYKLNRQEISFFCDNMSMMLKSGISIASAIEIMSDDLKESKLKDVLENLHKEVSVNYSFVSGLEKSMSFPKYVVDMIKIGEMTGKLDEVFATLSIYYRKEDDMIGRIKTAVLYPVIMIALMGVIIFFLVYNVLPIFDRVFLQLGDSVASSSLRSIDIGFFIGQISYYVIIFMVLVIVSIVITSKFKKGRFFINNICQSIPVIRNILYQISVSKFSYALSTFLSSGLDIDKSMDLSMELINNNKFNDKLKKCIKLMKNGFSIAEALAKEDVFGSIYGGMFTNSMISGNQEHIIKKIADLYEKRTVENMDNIISMVVPVSITIMTLMVGVILMSVMLPLLGIMSSIG